MRFKILILNRTLIFLIYLIFPNKVLNERGNTNPTITDGEGQETTQETIKTLPPKEVMNTVGTNKPSNPEMEVTPSEVETIEPVTVRTVPVTEPLVNTDTIRVEVEINTTKIEIEQQMYMRVYCSKLLLIDID